MKNTRDVAVLAVGLLALLPTLTYGQDLGPQPLASPSGYVQQDGAAQPLAAPGDTTSPPPAPPSGDLTEAGTNAPPSQPQAYTQEQIDQLVAPIALYPDALVSQILMASTYPLEIVEAQRWRQDPQNAQLQGDQLQAALDQQPWDPSVKSLVPMPQVLSMLNNNLQWTEQLGDAFLASQPAVMGSVQNLRQKAQAAGNLKSTPQQTVEQQQGDIEIQPTNPQVVYVPYYNPTVVYGAWPYAGYPPYYFPPPPGYVYYNVGLFGFGVGLAVADWFWGWGQWDWHRHELFVDNHRFAALNHGSAPHFAGGAWAHDPGHRHGVPYRNAAVATRYQGAANQARQGYRGYFNAPNRGTTASARGGAVNAAQRGGTTGFARPAGNAEIRNAATRNAAAETHTNVAAQSRAAATPEASHGGIAAAPQHQTRSAPMFESFSHGSDVRAQSARGSTSRASMATASHSETSHAAPQAAHGGGGNAGGGGGHQEHH